MENNYLKSKKIAQHIIDVMLNKKNTEPEEEFREWVRKNKRASEFLNDFSDEDTLTTKLEEFTKIDKQVSAKRLLERIDAAEKRRATRRIFKYVGSAAASVVLAFFTWQYIDSSIDPLASQSTNVTLKMASEIAPVEASTNAILVLEDGKQIDLYSSIEEVMADTSIRREMKLNRANKTTANNTLITPKGVTFEMTLSDGTKVWLNENSKLIYPVKFSGSTRNVRLEGEAYFEVAENRDTAFVVKSQNNAEIKVLGTKFNVNSNGANTFTTLVEGSVEVISNYDKVIIKPSEQAVVNQNRKSISISEVDTYMYTAWKDGRYAFNDESIRSVMEKISEWYDVEVEYANEIIPHLKLSGSLRKYNSFNEVIQVMESTGLIEIKIKNPNHIKIYENKSLVKK